MDSQRPARSSSEALYERSVTAIEDEYVRLGHTRGWIFLNTPRRTLASSASVALLSMHPGGDRPALGQPLKWGSYEAGSAYVNERWNDAPAGESPLQRQVRAMFDWLGLDPNDTLSAYFIPFRSPSYDALPERQASFDFAVGLWGGILSQVRPPLIVCLGGQAEHGLHRIWGKPPHAASFEVGWRRQAAMLSRYAGHALLRLPHLSRFRIFERSASEAGLNRLHEAMHEVLLEVGSHRS